VAGILGKDGFGSADEWGGADAIGARLDEGPKCPVLPGSVPQVVLFQLANSVQRAQVAESKGITVTEAEIDQVISGSEGGAAGYEQQLLQQAVAPSKMPRYPRSTRLNQEETMLLRTTDPFRDLDRLTQQLMGTTNRPAVIFNTVAAGDVRPEHFNQLGAFVGSVQPRRHQYQKSDKRSAQRHFAPLAHATCADTALMPRNRTATPVCCGCHWMVWAESATTTVASSPVKTHTPVPPSRLRFGAAGRRCLPVTGCCPACVGSSRRRSAAPIRR